MDAESLAALRIHRKQAVTVLLLIVASVLTVTHVAAVRTMREATLPAASALPALQQHRDLLRAQLELAELQTALQTGSIDERIRMSVVPEDVGFSNVLVTADAIVNEGRANGSIIGVGAIMTEDPRPYPLDAALDQNVVALDVTLSLTLTQEGVEWLMALVDVSGLLTVGDAIDPDQRALLVQLTEHENPTAITALEGFLSTDVLTYAQDTAAVERQLLKAFANPLIEQALTNLTQQSRLRDVRRVLSGDFGLRLKRARAWPMRLMTVQSATMDRLASGAVQSTIILRAFARQTAQ